MYGFKILIDEPRIQLSLKTFSESFNSSRLFWGETGSNELQFSLIFPWSTLKLDTFFSGFSYRNFFVWARHQRILSTFPMF